MSKKTSPSAVSSGKRHDAMATTRQSSDLPARYHPALVALHWTLALLLALALGMGTLVLAQMPNDAADKIGALRGHMIIGIAIGVLMLARLIVRWRTSHPPVASSGHAALDRLRGIAHAGLYLLVFVMAASGMATALWAGLPEIVFGGAMLPLPESFYVYPSRHVHGWVATALFVVIGFHLIGALFHQFRLKDRLLSRMWFGSGSLTQHPTRRAE